jgi:DNA polymerase I
MAKKLEQRLLLIDGSSYLYRAFHAMADLKNSQGMFTGALYGLVSMLRKTKENYPSTYCACIFDAKEKTFRHDMYPEYKANRSSMPENLVTQIQYVDDLVKALGWLTIKVPTIEADDVIGTLSKHACPHMPVLIATGDKDMAQLVNHNVHLVDTMKNVYMDIEGVKGKFDLLPEQIIDYLALMGDTSDNIVGIDKVGPKTAVKWLKQYNNIDNILLNADKITGVVGENLRKSFDIVKLAKTLVTIDQNCEDKISAYVPNWQSWRDFSNRDEDSNSLREMFIKFEFKGWLYLLDKSRNNSSSNESIDFNKESLCDNAIQPPTDSINADEYKLISNNEQLNLFINELNQYHDTASIQVQASSINPMIANIIGISIAINNNAVYIPFNNDNNKNSNISMELLKPWLENKNHKKVGHNIKYVMHVFKNIGISIAGLNDDIMLASYILASHHTHHIDDLSKRYLNYQNINYEILCGKGAGRLGFEQVDISSATKYAAGDADIILHLYNILIHKLKNADLLSIYNMECELSHVLCDTERAGILIDSEKLYTQSHELGIKIKHIEHQVHDIVYSTNNNNDNNNKQQVEINLNSPKQIGEMLFEKLKLPVVKKTASGSPSTDEEVLTKLAHNHPIAKLILDHRALSKLKTTYTDKLPSMANKHTGRIHTTFAQAVAITGRLSSLEPNLQNIPIKTAEGRRVRNAFIAKPGCCLISADYSQIELRIMAHLSQDPSLLSAFSNNEDVHQATAKQIFELETLEQVSKEQRRYAKIINFGLIYGMSAFGVANNLGIDNKEAQQYIDTYFIKYVGVAAYMQQTKLDAKENGFVQTILGRRLYLDDINSNMYIKRQASERAAVNAPMQGSAADIIKLAMIKLHNYLFDNKLESKILLQVHDELILEVPYTELEHIQNILKDIMENILRLKVPLIVNVGVGDTWEDGKY